MLRVKGTKNMLSFLNQCWNFFTTKTRKGDRVHIVAGEINEKGTVSYDTHTYICSLRKSPNQKQIAKLMLDIVERLTNPGDVILDPFLGGGTTGVAAVSKGRKFIGADIETKNVEISHERIKEAYNNASNAGKNILA